MTSLLAVPCECTYQTSMGEKKPTVCFEHGNPYVYASSYDRGTASTSSRRYRKSSEPKRDWSLAQLKVEDEGEVCRVCGAPGIERAHILGRKYDQPISPGSRTLLVLPDRVVPLCGESANRCHQRHDAHELDLLSFLDAAEQTQAVLDAGGIESARRRLAPSAYVESLAG